MTPTHRDHPRPGKNTRKLPKALRACQTVVVQGRRPADPPEYFEVARDEGDVVWCQPWCPLDGRFVDQLVPVRRAHILRLADGHDRLPITPGSANPGSHSPASPTPETRTPELANA